MGSATITENIGEGLYKIRLNFDLTAIDRELAALQALETEYLAAIVRAIDSRNLLENDVSVARIAVNEIIQQWQDDLIKRGQEQPGALTPADPTDPETGLPWEDPDRAQEAPLLAAINAARTAASVGTVTRDDELDAACLAHLRYQKGNGQIGHIGVAGSKARDRAGWAGYANPTTLHEALAYGPRTPASASAKMLTSNAAKLLDVAATKAGVAHVYAGWHVSSYLWAVIMASDEGPPTPVVVEEDPAKTAADESEQTLEKIEKPELDSLKPKKLGEAVKKFALAQQKYLAAQREVERLMAEKLIRSIRITELETLRDELEEMDPIDCWCCNYSDQLAVGAVVKTVEIPGWWNDTAVGRSSVLFADTPNERTVFWYERSINIAADGIGVPGKDYGKLAPTAAMTPAAVVYNYAIEPGHYRWKPTWRYGIASEVALYSCTVTLENTPSRKLISETALPINDALVLTNVPFYYPPCNGNVFEDGDEVVVEFDGFDRTVPVVVGFRREPKQCQLSPTWGQIS